jgi:hypothetical protein
MVCVHRHPKSLYGIDRSTAANNLRPSAHRARREKIFNVFQLGFKLLAQRGD